MCVCVIFLVFFQKKNVLYYSSENYRLPLTETGVYPNHKGVIVVWKNWLIHFAIFRWMVCVHLSTKREESLQVNAEFFWLITILMGVVSSRMNPQGTRVHFEWFDEDELDVNCSLRLSQSSDLNPAEHLLAILERTILAFWAYMVFILPETCTRFQRLIESMPRMQTHLILTVTTVNCVILVRMGYI